MLHNRINTTFFSDVRHQLHYLNFLGFSTFLQLECLVLCIIFAVIEGSKAWLIQVYRKMQLGTHLVRNMWIYRTLDTCLKNTSRKHVKHTVLIM